MDLNARIVADRAYFSPYFEWADALSAWLVALSEETKQTGEQAEDRWRLLIDLLRSGTHAFWALARVAETQSDQAALSRAAMAQERTRADMVGLLDPQILVRRPGDVSLLAEQYGSLERRELLSSRAREDMVYLSRQPGEIDPGLADAMLRRLPSGVMVWA